MTANIQRSTFNVPRSRRTALDVRCWALVVISILAFKSVAQTPPPAQPIDPLLQLMISQPSIEVTSNLVATAAFDPPMVKPGEKAIYRFTVNALTDSVEWPDTVPFPPGLQTRLSARGQSLAPAPGEPKLKPQTAINYHVHPSAEGVFQVPEFTIRVYDRVVHVPAAELQVNWNAAPASPQTLALELAETNCYLGQAVPVRVLLKTGNVVQSVQEMKLNGEGFLVDIANARQSITGSPDGSGAAYVYETTLLPLRVGELTVSAQGFTAGNLFTGGVIIRGQVTIPGGAPQYRLLDSELLKFWARPLPRENELPGFTGAIGRFTVHPPQLSTNRLRAGETLKLLVTVEGSGNMARLVPPEPPRSTNWQVHPAERGAPVARPVAANVAPAAMTTFSYTMIPLTDEAETTPPIPFSYFDPESGQYVDASIAGVPVTVGAGEASINPELLATLTSTTETEKKPQFSDVTEREGWTAASLRPLQYRAWFLGVQLLPLIGFLGLWQWDRRRRFYEQHPEVLVRRRARRALRRARRDVRHALARRDAQLYLRQAIRAIQVASAPQHAAEPRALVGRDVAVLFPEETADARIVRQLFAASDAMGFSGEPALHDELLRLHPQVEQLLNALEARL